jgi:hypothetical protein
MRPPTDDTRLGAPDENLQQAVPRHGQEAATGQQQRLNYHMAEGILGTPDLHGLVAAEPQNPKTDEEQGVGFAGENYGREFREEATRQLESEPRHLRPSCPCGV